MASNYSITFKSLRAGTVYTVNIGGGTGAAIPLKGGAHPFVTEEDSDEDMFIPIRTQTGYLRIVDDGFDARTPAQAFDWKDLIPATDTSRPLTLSGFDAQGNNLGVLWQGFMQAQDFGNTLYGNPQEREFPIQCVLSVTQGTDINYQQTQIQNFAYLLKQIVDSIPSAQRPTHFMIQGGSDAQDWLMKMIDWQNFVSEDADGNLTARYSMYQCLEDMCRFWGWTARTKGSTLYLTMADDATAEPNWLSLTYANLTTMAGGTAAGTTSATFDTTTLTGDIFANTNQNDYVQRGHNKAIVNADGNTAKDLIDYAPEIVHDAFVRPSRYNIIVSPYAELDDDDIQGSIEYEYYDAGQVTFIPNLLQFPQKKVKSPFLSGTAVSGKASFTSVSISNNKLNDTDAIRINKSYSYGVVLASLETTFAHSFRNGRFKMYGNVYVAGEKFVEVIDGFEIGQKHMYIRLGVGTDRANAKWYTGSNWGNTPVDFKVNIGNEGNQFFFSDQGIEYIDVDLAGKIFIDFMGSDDTQLVDGSTGGGTEERRFFITDFSFEYTGIQGASDPRRRPIELTNDSSASYVSVNPNNVKNEWNADCIYATQNLMKPGYGILMNSNYTMFESVNYGTNAARPEQHLADRVVNYWQTSKRRMEVELRSNTIADITPKYKITIDDTTGYPIAISRDWRDDITKLTILELD